MLERRTIPGGQTEPHTAKDTFRLFMTLFDSQRTHHSRQGRWNEEEKVGLDTPYKFEYYVFGTSVLTNQTRFRAILEVELVPFYA